MFSAIKVNGKPLYRLARKGIEVERKEREVEIYNLQIQSILLPRVRFSVTCSKGTYIRALARDIGRHIGCGAHLLSLTHLMELGEGEDYAIHYRLWTCSAPRHININRNYFVAPPRETASSILVSFIAVPKRSFVSR
jgi:hypothetical protein